jgi:hypothetical protein
MRLLARNMMKDGYTLLRSRIQPTCFFSNMLCLVLVSTNRHAGAGEKGVGRIVMRENNLLLYSC